MPSPSSSRRRSTKKGASVSIEESYANLLSDDYSPASSRSISMNNKSSNKKSHQASMKQSSNPVAASSSSTSHQHNNRSPSSTSSSMATSPSSSRYSSAHSRTSSSSVTSTSYSSATSSTDPSTTTSSTLGGSEISSSSGRNKSSSTRKKNTHRAATKVQASRAPPSRQKWGGGTEKIPYSEILQQKKDRKKRQQKFVSTVPMNLQVAPKRSAAELTRALQRLEGIAFLDKEEITVDADAEFQSILLSHIRIMETKKQRQAQKAAKDKESHHYRSQIIHERLSRLQTEEENERDLIHRFERQHMESLIRTLEKDIKEDIEIVAQQETLRQKYWSRTLSMILRAELTNRKQIIFAEGHTRIQISQHFEREVTAHLTKLRKEEHAELKQRNAARIQEWEKKHRAYRIKQEEQLLEKSGLTSFRSSNKTTTNNKKVVAASSVEHNKKNNNKNSLGLDSEDLFSGTTTDGSYSVSPAEPNSPSKQASAPPPSDVAAPSSPKVHDDDDKQQQHHSVGTTSSTITTTLTDDEPSPQRPASSVPSDARGAKKNNNNKQQQKGSTTTTANKNKSHHISGTSYLQQFSEEENENIRRALADLELERREEIELDEEDVRNSLIGALTNTLMAIVARLEKEGQEAIEKSKHQLQRHMAELEVLELDKRSKIEIEEEASFKNILRKYERAAAIEWKKYDENVVRHVAHEKRMMERQRRIDARRATASNRIEMNRKLLQITDPSAIKVTSTSLFTSVYQNNSTNNSRGKAKSEEPSSSSNNNNSPTNQDHYGGLVVFEGLASMKPKPPTTAPSISGTTSRFLPSIHGHKHNHHERDDDDDDDDDDDEKSHDNDDDDNQQKTSRKSTAATTTTRKKKTPIDPYSTSFLRKREEGFSTTFNADRARGGPALTARAGAGGSSSSSFLPSIASARNGTRPSPLELEATRIRQKQAQATVLIRNLINKERKLREEIEREQRTDQFQVYDLNTDREHTDERLFKAKFKREIDEEDRFNRAEEKVRQDDLRGKFMALFLEHERALAQRIKDCEALEKHERLELIGEWRDDVKMWTHEQNEIIRFVKHSQALQVEETHWRKQLELEANRQLKAVRETIRKRLDKKSQDMFTKSYIQPTHHQKSTRMNSSKRVSMAESDASVQSAPFA